MAEFQVAWPFIRLEPDDLSEFVSRWAGWLASAANGGLSRPSTMPERSDRHGRVSGRMAIHSLGARRSERVREPVGRLVSERRERRAQQTFDDARAFRSAWPSFRSHGHSFAWSPTI